MSITAYPANYASVREQLCDERKTCVVFGTLLHSDARLASQRVSQESVADSCHRSLLSFSLRQQSWQMRYSLWGASAETVALCLHSFSCTPLGVELSWYMSGFFQVADEVCVPAAFDLTTSSMSCMVGMELALLHEVLLTPVQPVGRDRCFSVVPSPGLWRSLMSIGWRRCELCDFLFLFTPDKTFVMTMCVMCL